MDTNITNYLKLLAFKFLCSPKVNRRDVYRVFYSRDIPSSCVIFYETNLRLFLPISLVSKIVCIDDYSLRMSIIHSAQYEYLKI